MEPIGRQVVFCWGTAVDAKPNRNDDKPAASASRCGMRARPRNGRATPLGSIEGWSPDERLSFALTAGQLGSWELDLQSRELFTTDIYKANWGRAASDEFSYDTLLAAIHPEDRDMHERAVADAITFGGTLDIEYRNIWPDGTVHWLRVRGRAVYDQNGAPQRMAGISLDITDRKRTEDSLREEIAERRRIEGQLRLLLTELNHRVKNTLAIVQSIATQTLRHTDSAEAFRAGFEARVMALAEAHNLLTESNWGGASLKDIVERVLIPYCGAQRRHELPDDDVQVGPKAAVSLVMAFHELATNAAKYGALSKGEGSLRVDWKVIDDVDPPRLFVKWQESGGPPVKVPTRQGFGSRLIRGLAQESSGEVRLDFARSGLVCTIDIPLYGEQ
jgi:two-component sensor histidine kinase